MSDYSVEWEFRVIGPKGTVAKYGDLVGVEGDLATDVALQRRASHLIGKQVEETMLVRVFHQEMLA